MAHDHNAIREVSNHSHIMSDDHYTRAELPVKPAKHIENFRLNCHVQGRGRLIRDQQSRLAREGHCDHYALALATRELMGVVVEPPDGIGYTNECKQLNRLGSHLSAGQGRVPQPDRFAQLEADGENRIQSRDRVLEDHRNVAAAHGGQLLRAQIGQIPATEPDRALAGRIVRKQSKNGHCGHTLAGTGFADECEDLARHDVETDAVDGANRLSVDTEVYDEVTHCQYRLSHGPIIATPPALGAIQWNNARNLVERAGPAAIEVGAIINDTTGHASILDSASQDRTVPQLSVNEDRLIADLKALGQIGRVPAGGLSRTSFSDADNAARAWYLGRCADAGLTVAVDGLQNVVVTAPPVDPDLASRPAVWSGSHIDTVPNGGQFDGALGAIAALECVRRIHEEALILHRPIFSVVYSDEEGNYSHLLGSSGLVRGYSRSELENLVGRDGNRFVDAFEAAGGSTDLATRTKIDPSSLSATVELHIEQGPTLERLGCQIGIVTDIVGLGGGLVTFRGRADHAGTTPMNMRKDALLAASAFVVAVPHLAERAGRRAVATCGRIEVEPGGANVVPETARVAVDFRDPDAMKLSELEAAIRATAISIGSQYGIDVQITFDERIPPTQLDPHVQEAIAESAASRGLSSMLLPSGAGHDSQNMAVLAPTGMIFVPSVGGRSHCPEELTSWPDVVNGANVLLDTLVRLASS